ncbi:MAG: PH domain-containing protein [Microcella pacifica]
MNSPPRARILRWFSQPRNGFAVSDGAVMLRRGAIWRDLTIVPFPRMQSVSVRQGPLLRSLRLAAIQVHTVAGPITPSLGASRRDAGDGALRHRGGRRDPQRAVRPHASLALRLGRGARRGRTR